VAAIALISLGYTLFVILLASEGRRRTRLETEMGIARRIQDALLPAGGLHAGWCDVNGATVPAEEVGGDYFDYLELPDGRITVVVADVAGHGVGAGILSAMTKSSFRSLVAADPSPVRLLGELNRTLCQLVQRNYFVTMAYMVIDPRTRTARIATAGHPPVLHFRGGEPAPAPVRTPSMALGMKGTATFAEAAVAWAPGDLFLFYTDGVLEARDRRGGEYGGERLRESVANARARNSGELPGAVIASLRAHTSSSGFADDVTVVSVQLRP
jgi:sigma-B regulation protein RsbU (phosphoserine phosphatase)